MGVRITDDTHVALYDSVTDAAFGILFASKADALEFLDWLQESEGIDARMIPGSDWEDTVIRWKSVTGRTEE